jgi:hypothetical protein
VLLLLLLLVCILLGTKHGDHILQACIPIFRGSLRIHPSCFRRTQQLLLGRHLRRAGAARRPPPALLLLLQLQQLLLLLQEGPHSIPGCCSLLCRHGVAPQGGQQLRLGGGLLPACSSSS